MLFVPHKSRHQYVQRARSAARRIATAARALLLGTREEGRAAIDCFAAPMPSPGLAGGNPTLQRLESRLARIGAAAGGKVGVAALHLESGGAVSVNGTVPFPLASTVKVAIALQLLALVDHGDLRLDSMVVLAPGHVHPGAGLIRRFRVPGFALSLHNLLELALVISDNSAADILFDLVGGADAVTGRLHALGRTDISIDRATVRLLADLCGVTDLPADVALTRGRWRKLTAAVPPGRKQEAERAFFSDTRDTGTPEGMARLLATIACGEGLSAQSTALLLDMMFRCETGTDRLKGLLPPNTRVAHKTGTFEGGGSPRTIRLAADVGVIDLPGRAGRVAIAVSVMGSPRSERIQNRVIAKISRAVYDHFVASPMGPPEGQRS
jgi:beta-lactamase class A